MSVTYVLVAVDPAIQAVIFTQDLTASAGIVPEQAITAMNGIPDWVDAWDVRVSRTATPAITAYLGEVCAVGLANLVARCLHARVRAR